MNLSNITSELHLFKYYQQTQLEETASYILQAIYETPGMFPYLVHPLNNYLHLKLCQACIYHDTLKEIKLKTMPYK